MYEQKLRQGNVKSSVLSIALVLCAACARSPTSPVPKDFCAIARAIRAAIPGGAAGFLTTEEEADITARTIPGGFGGLYEDFARGVLVVRLKDLSKREEAEKALRRVLACGAVYPGWLNIIVSLDAVQFQAAQYDATELLGYFRNLQALRSDPGVWAMEVDPELNRIWIGARADSVQNRLQQVIGSAGVLLAAVVLETPPPTSGVEPFKVLESTVQTAETVNFPGVFSFAVHIRYSNQFAETRYPDQCLLPFLSYPFFLGILTRWNGSGWIKAWEPICEAILLPPRPVSPGGQQTDSIPFTGAHRLGVIPVWISVRVTGTYRFEGMVYKSTTSSPPILTDLAPLEERISAPFRIIRQAP